MSDVITEPALQRQTLPFSPCLPPPGYHRLINVKPPQPPPRVAFGWSLPSVRIRGPRPPPLLCVCFHQRLHAYLSAFTSACAREPSWLRSTSRACLLMCDLCHVSPTFSPALFAVSTSRLSRIHNRKWLSGRCLKDRFESRSHYGSVVDTDTYESILCTCMYIFSCIYSAVWKSLFSFFTGHVSTANCQKGSRRLTDFDILH